MLGISGDKLKKMNLICNNIQSVLVLKLQICSNRIDILGDNLSIMQISHLLMPSSWWETPKHHVSTGNYIQLNWTVEKFTKYTHKHTSQTSHYTFRVMTQCEPHSCPSVVTTFYWIPDHLLLPCHPMTLSSTINSKALPMYSAMFIVIFMYCCSISMYSLTI